MSLTDLIYRLRSAGAKLELAAGNIKLHMQTPTALPAALLEEVRMRKQELLEWLASPAAAYEILPAPVAATYPLSYAQKRLWLFEQAVQSSAYCLSDAVEIKGTLDEVAFEHALQHIYDRHESLRTSFITEDGAPRQYISSADERPMRYELKDISAEPDKEKMLHELLDMAAALPFQLEEGPLFRLQLIKLEPVRYVLQLTMHHIISDLWSMQNFTNELLACYDAAVKAVPWPLPSLPLQYKDYACWENAPVHHVYMEEHLAFWRLRLATAPTAPEFPVDYPRQPERTFNGQDIFLHIAADRYKLLKNWCNKNGATTYAALLTMVNVLLARYTGESQTAIGISVNGRNYPGLEEQIGFFVNLLPLHLALDMHAGFLSAVTHCRQQLLEVLEHQAVPFDMLIEHMPAIHKRPRNRFPFFDILVEFAAQEEITDTGAFAMLETASYDTKTQTSQFDLLWGFTEEADGLRVKINYNTALYREQRICMMLRHFDNLLSAVMKDTAASLGDIIFLDKEERQWLNKVSGNTLPLAVVSADFSTLFNEIAVRYSSKHAISFEGSTYTYQWLDQASTTLAAVLQQQGIGPGDRVAFTLRNSHYTLASLLAILKAGAVFVPVDNNLPVDRKQFILQLAEISAVMFESFALLDVPPLERVALIAVDLELEAPAATFQPVIHHPEDIAYVIFTSGSTGVPKGVEVRMQSFMNYLLWANDHYFTPEERNNFAFFTTIAFDLTLTSIFTTLLRGDMVCIFPSSGGTVLSAVFGDPQVDVVKLTPTHIRLLNVLSVTTTAVRIIISGGEPLLASDIALLQSLHAGIHIYDEYGPTEATVGCMVKKANGLVAVGSVGVPIRHARINVLDDRLMPLPQGYIGEIYIGGGVLAKGYLNEAAMTAGKFIPSPFHPGEYIYRSGDTGYWNADGELQLLGRRDGQVKINGIRIELNEIQYRLRSHPQVKDLVLRIIVDASEDKVLEAFIVPANEGSEQLGEQVIRDWCRRYLPEYMIPARIYFIETIPVTDNGKVDYSALDTIERRAPEKAAYRAPANELQRLLVEAWSEMLGIPAGINDNFFELGGDSIKAIRISGKLFQQGYRLSVADILSCPSIEAQAACISADSRQIAQLVEQGPVPLLPIQHAFFEHVFPERHHYNQCYMLHRDKRFEEAALKAVFNKIVRHHDMLRVSFHEEQQQVIQFVHDHVPEIPLRIVDMRGVPDAEVKTRQIAQEVQMAMDLTCAPLLRLVLFRQDTTDQLLVCIHHLVVDEISWTILLEDINTLLLQYEKKELLQLPLKTNAYREWAVSLMTGAGQEALQHRYYWEQQQQLTTASWKPDYSVAATEHDSDTLEIKLDGETTGMLLTQANTAFNTRMEDLLICALGRTVHQTFQVDAYWLDRESHGRGQGEGPLDLSRTVGWFTSLCPLLLPAAASSDPADYIKTVKAQLREGSHRQLAYGQLRYLRPANEEADNALHIQPRIIFNYLGHHDEQSVALDFEVMPFDGVAISPSRPRIHEFEFEAYVSNGVLSVLLTYARTQYNTDTVRQLIDNFRESLIVLTDYCCNRQETSYTPHDFDFAGLSADDLDEIGSQLG